MTRAGAVMARVKVASATNPPIPMPSELMQTSANARSLASDRAA